ncbi:MAG: glycosyltransferase [Bacteroidales bacterium]|nr:glycosyltransferase [Bacteroidales bacterium]
MKFIIVGTAYPYRSAVSTFNHSLARQLKVDGNEVEILTYTRHHTGKHISGDQKPDDLKITRMIHSTNPLSWKKASNYIEDSQPDEVIFAYTDSRSSVCMGHIAKNLNHAAKIKKLAIVKDIIPDNAKFIDRILPYNLVRNVDGFVCISKNIAEDIEHFEKTPKPKKYTYLPVNSRFGERIPREEALSQLNLDPEYRYLLFFGSIRPFKGLDIMIDAFSDERLRKYKLKLIIAGEFRDNIQPYIDKIEERNISDFLEVRSGYVEYPDVKKYFSAADMLLQTYKTPHESGVTRLAFHFEKPMLVTNVRKLSDIVDNGSVGYVVEPNAQSIAEAIIDFYENNRGEEMEKNVAVEKLKFSWKNLTNTLETFFE